MRDNDKCILCRRCVAACADQQCVRSSAPNDRGFDTHIGCAFEQPLGDVACVSCGQCIVGCPTGALHEKRPHRRGLGTRSTDPEKHVVVQTAPAIRATLGECFGMPIGTNVEGKMVAALRRLGFDKVFDTDFGADLTIMEEATRVPRPGEERRHAADDHLLLARLDQVLRALLSRTCCRTSPPASPRSR